ncbi:hypothetical protein NHQ30_011140 [Ciborinia camelliae]|nr:hypothetical protein NHQ30_011140 [Ciborinia camelliae]
MPRNRVPRMSAPTSWTILQIPVTRTLSNKKTEDGQKWLEIIKPLTKESQPGFEHGVWARLMERPDEVWIVTGWETFEAIQQFEESNAHKEQSKAMRELSEGKELIITHAGLSGDFWNMLTDYTGVMDVYFPEGMEEDAKMRVNDLRGLVYFLAPGKKSGKSAYNGRATKGWVNELVEFEGKKCRVMRYIHYWNSKEGEEEFKKEAGFVTEAGETKNIFRDWVEGLKNEGMIGMQEVHCKFETIPWKFWEYTSEDKREMAEMNGEE